MKKGRIRNERGAVLVLTSISFVALLSFAAFSVDLGLRNQYLARDQHAIDAATLAAAASLVVNPDLNTASRVVKEVLKQNLGFEFDFWQDCQNPNQLPSIATDDQAINNNCISFGPGPNGNMVSEIQLPEHNISSIFGGVAGVDTLTLSASASADGSSCEEGVDAECIGGEGGGGYTTTSTPSSSTTPSPSTTNPWETDCFENWALNEANLNKWYYNQCKEFHPGKDWQAYWGTFCYPGQDREQMYMQYWKTNGTWDGNYNLVEYYGCAKVPGLEGSRYDYAVEVCTEGNRSWLLQKYIRWAFCQDVFPEKYGWWGNQPENTTTTTLGGSTTTTSPGPSTSVTPTTAGPSGPPSTVDIN